MSAEDRIAEVIRTELDLTHHDGDHLFEGSIHAGELANAIVQAIGLTPPDGIPYTPREISFLVRAIGLEGELKAERAHADRWQKLAGRYDDIRYELRNCDDNPSGHAKFYNECAQLIFGETS